MSGTQQIKTTMSPTDASTKLFTLLYWEHLHIPWCELSVVLVYKSFVLYTANLHVSVKNVFYVCQHEMC